MALTSDHLSPSRLGRYEQYPLASRLHDITRHEGAPGLRLLVGDASHAAPPQAKRYIIAENLADSARVANERAEVPAIANPAYAREVEPKDGSS